MEHHNQSFFGQKSAIILDSAKSSEPYIYLRFLKKLPDGRWEKPSQGEGKNLKLNLLEIVDILYVLNTPNTRWSTVHKFGDQQTSIKVEHRADSDSVLFFITGYAKPLSRTEAKLFTDLLNHIYCEKIKYATGGNNQNAEISEIKTKKSNLVVNEKDSPSIEDPKAWLNHLPQEEDYCRLPGRIQEKRERALLYSIEERKNLWIPLSQIKGDQNGEDTEIWVKKWFIEAKLGEIFESA